MKKVNSVKTACKAKTFRAYAELFSRKSVPILLTKKMRRREMFQTQVAHLLIKTQVQNTLFNYYDLCNKES